MSQERIGQNTEDLENESQQYNSQDLSSLKLSSDFINRDSLDSLVESYVLYLSRKASGTQPNNFDPADLQFFTEDQRKYIEHHHDKLPLRDLKLHVDNQNQQPSNKKIDRQH
jgi:hypothetical protein